MTNHSHQAVEKIMLSTHILECLPLAHAYKWLQARSLESWCRTLFIWTLQMALITRWQITHRQKYNELPPPSVREA
uniref:Uncharacterized protein n=1 Tax=Rhizophora mucronata TaxID=61149 RepID=A0A2P2QWR2_RHIMU